MIPQQKQCTCKNECEQVQESFVTCREGWVRGGLTQKEKRAVRNHTPVKAEIEESEDGKWWWFKKE